MSTPEDMVRQIELQAARGRNQIRHDLDSLLTLLPAEELLERWRGLQVRPKDLRKVRREFALTCHPDRLRGSAEANRRLTIANALIDQAIEEIAGGAR